MPTIAASDPVHVAVGIVAERENFFITRRPVGTHLAGKWEFPGGKVLPGESVLAALRRELHEELGIEVRAAEPFMKIHHRYPDKAVLLDVWRVTSFTGNPHGREGQEARWHSRIDLLRLDFPEADLPIQRRLWLPTLYGISVCARYGRGEFLRRLEFALTAGLRLLQLREPGMEAGEFLALAREVVTLCHRHDAKVLLNVDVSLVDDSGADGIHLSSTRLMQLSTRPRTERSFVAASCHNEAELRRATEIGVDLVVIGPVLPTATHLHSAGIGWERFASLCLGAPPAVYALGGMRAADVARARVCGAQGLAMISGLWEAHDVADVVVACETSRDQTSAPAR